MTLSAFRNPVDGTVIITCAYGRLRFEVTEPESCARSFAMQLLRLVPDEPVENRAQAGYERFHAMIGGKYDPWDTLAPAHQDAWIAAFTE